MERVTHEMRRRKWAAIIKECNESGKKKKVWLAEHNINPKAFYRWQKRLRVEIGTGMILSEKDITAPVVHHPAPEFGLVSPPDFPSVINTASAVIRKGDLEIEVSNGISDQLLHRIIQAVKNV